MAFGSNGNTTINGTVIKPAARYDSEINIFASTFAKRSADLASKAIVSYKSTDKARKAFKTNINTAIGEGDNKTQVNKQMIELLNNAGIMGLHKHTPLTHTAIHGFNFKYQQQENMRTSTVDAMVSAYTNFTRLKTNNTGALYVFDLETYGGTTIDKRWAPYGITEFAMQKYDFATKQQTSTSVLMTNDETVAGLEKFLDRYKLLMEKGIDAVKEENDVYVFASRMSLHAPSKGARFNFNEASGLWEVTNFVDSSEAAPGNIDAVIEGVNQFIAMNKKLKEEHRYRDPVTGLPYDQLAFINATGEMSSAMARGQGIIGGHNILHFDRPVLDRGIMNIYNTQMDIINSGQSTPEQVAQAKAAVSHISSVFGGNIGANFRKGYVLDTLPLMRAAHDDSGFINLPNLQLGTLFDAYYDPMEGVAHLGEYDTRMNMKFYMDASPTLGMPLIQHVMENNILKSNSANPAVDFNNNMVFKATGNVSSAGYGGRGFVNHRVYSNGEIFTSGGYRIQNGKVHHTDAAGNTGFNSGGFYTPLAQGIVSAKDLDPTTLRQLQEAYPELSTDNIYYMSFASHDISEKAEKHIVNVFGSTQEELEAIVGGTLTHVADQTTDGYSVVKKNIGYLKSGSYNIKTGKFVANNYLNDTHLVTSAITASEERRANSAASRGVFGHKKAMQRIKGILEFDEAARAAGLGKGLDAMRKDGISFNTMIKGSSGKYGDVTYFTDKQFKQLQDLYRVNLGYIPKDEKEHVLDFRTKTNTSAAYEVIMDKAEYYRKLIAQTEAHYGDNVSDEILSAHFRELDKRATVNILKSNGFSNVDAIHAATGTSNISTREEAYYGNRYEFFLGNKFRRTGETAQPLVNVIGGNRTPDDLVTYNLGSVNANSTFLKQLYIKRMGDAAANSVRSDVDIQKKQAAYDFALDLYHNGNIAPLYENKKFAKYMDDLIANRDIVGHAAENFDPNEFLTHLGEAIKGVKSKDPYAGIEHVYGDVNVIEVSAEVANLLNAADPDEIKSIGQGIKKIKRYSKEDKAAGVNNILRVFGIDDTTFEDNTAHLKGVDKDTVSLIRDISHGQLKTFAEDMFNVASEFDMTIHIDELNRELYIQKGDMFIPVDKMPKLNLKSNGALTIKSGASEMNLELALRQNKDGTYSRVSTNADPNFGKKDYFLGIFRSRFASNGEVSLYDINRYLGPNVQETYENTKYTGLKTDLTTANKRFDLSGADGLLPELIRKDGRLSHRLNDIKFQNPETLTLLRQHIDRINKTGVLDTDSMPPDVFMLLANIYPELAMATLDPKDPYRDRAMKIAQNLGGSLKETAYVKGKMQIGDRVIASWTNIWDNPSRPPMTGAGNINYLDIEKVKALREFGVIAGSVMESEGTLNLIHKETESLRLVSDFRASQAYMSAPQIHRLTETKKKSILQNRGKINNRTINDMTEAYMNEVLNSLQETLTSGTFEQARIGDARVFNHIIDKPIDAQYLSLNKDIVGAFSNNNADDYRIRRLNELFGAIELGEDGKYTYRRRSGTMIRKGDVVAESLGFGGINEAFGSKFDRGVLFFSVSDNGIELSDDYISKLINQYSEQFDELNEYERKNALFNLLQDKGFRATYKIENANISSYLKVQDSGVEKGMTHILNTQLGRYNEGVRQYFEELQKLDPNNKMISNFKNGMIPTERAIQALHEDVAKKVGGSVEELVATVSGNMSDQYKDLFTNMGDVLGMVRDEREFLSELTFGEHGFVPGVISLANDNIPKHGNRGLAMTGNVSQAIKKYAQVSGKSYEAAAATLAMAMNDENNDMNFLRHTVNNSMTKGIGHTIEVDKYGTFITDEVAGEKSFLDEARLANFMIYTNDLIVKTAEEQNIRVDESMKLVHENVWTYNEDGSMTEHKQLIGNFMFYKEGDKTIAGSSVLNVAHGIIADSETESGVSHQYIQDMKAINRLASINPDDLTEQEKNTLRELRMRTAAQKKHVKFIKANDQMLSLLEQQKFSADMEEDLVASLSLTSGKEKHFTEDKLEFLTRKTGGAISYDKKTGQVRFSDDIRGQGFYDGIVQQIYDRQYYNETFGEELTAEMLKDPKYAHLKEIYDDVIGEGRAEKLGVHQAQNLYDLKGMALAADFNDPHFALTQDRFQEMIDNGFEVMRIEDYTPAMQSSSNDITGSIADKRIILDLGKDFSDRERYVAIPAGGQDVGESEVLTALQGNVNRLKKMSDSIVALEGSGRSDLAPSDKEALERHLKNMGKVREEIVELSDRFARKDTLYTTQASVEITEASDRLKIASVTSSVLTNEALKEMGLEQYSVDENSIQFLKSAKVLMQDGTEETLYDLEQRGINYNFKRVGIDHFRKQGLFDENNEITKEAAEKFGMNTEQLIDYLQTYGSMDMSIRFPLIRKDSMYASRAYLDRSLDGKNITSIGSVALLSFNGDSDGDSESSFMARLNDTSYALYEHHYRQAVNEVRAQGGTLTDSEFQRAVRENVIKRGVVSADEYEGFYKMSIGMAITAATEGPAYAEKATGILVEDVANNTAVGTATGLIYQVKHAKSKTLSSYTMQSEHINPSSEKVMKNMAGVREALEMAMKENPGSFSEETLQIAKDIASGTIDIGKVTGSAKYTVLDDALHALETSNISIDDFDRMQQNLMERVMMQQYYEEEGSKSAKAAIGSINKSLNSLKIVANKAFGTETINGEINKLYDSNAARVMQTGAEKIEQQVISFKKIAAELGDSRLIEMEDIMNRAKKGESNQLIKDEMAEWLSTYMDKGSTNAIWNDVRPAQRAMMEKEGGRIANFILDQRNAGSTLSDEELTLRAKNQYIAETIIESTNKLVTNDYWAAAITDISGSGSKTSSSSALRNNNPAPEVFLTGQTNNILREHGTKESADVLKTANRTSTDESLADLTSRLASDPVVNRIDQDILEKVPLSASSGLGMAVLGVAAGMMVMGYAGGGHQRTTPPQDDTKEQEPPVLDNMEGVSVGMSQQGYVINVSADTRKGARHLKRSMKDIAKATQSGNVTINMNYRTTNGGGYSNKDIENVINNFI